MYPSQNDPLPATRPSFDQSRALELADVYAENARLRHTNKKNALWGSVFLLAFLFAVVVNQRLGSKLEDTQRRLRVAEELLERPEEPCGVRAETPDDIYYDVDGIWPTRVEGTDTVNVATVFGDGHVEYGDGFVCEDALRAAALPWVQHAYDVVPFHP